METNDVMLQNLMTIRKTLEGIEVKGYVNMDRLLGVMVMLNNMIRDLQEKKSSKPTSDANERE